VTVTSGTITLGAGTAAYGKLAANSGVDIGDVDITSIIPGTGATNLGKAIDTATGATDTGVLTLATRDDALSALTPIEGDNVQLRVDANGALWVIPSGTVTVSGAVTVTNATAANLKCEATIAAAQTLATVTTVGTVTTCSTVTTVGTLTGGGIAHDSADSGNPVKIGVKATASVLGGTPVTAADRTDLFAGLDGVLIERPHTSLEDIISEVKTNTDGASTAMTGGFAATASQRIYLTSLIIANSSATNITVDIRDGSAGSVLATFPVPANGGCIHAFPVPLRFSSNTAAAFDGSAAATTLSVTMVGFKSKQ
jgi:hypothetical protein